MPGSGLPLRQEVTVRPLSGTQNSMVSGSSQWTPEVEYKVPLKSSLASSGVKSFRDSGSFPMDSSRALAP